MEGKELREDVHAPRKEFSSRESPCSQNTFSVLSVHNIAKLE